MSKNIPQQSVKININERYATVSPTTLNRLCELFSVPAHSGNSHYITLWASIPKIEQLFLQRAARDIQHHDKLCWIFNKAIPKGLPPATLLKIHPTCKNHVGGNFFLHVNKYCKSLSDMFYTGICVYPEKERRLPQKLHLEICTHVQKPINLEF